VAGLGPPTLLQRGLICIYPCAALQVRSCQSYQISSSGSANYRSPKSLLQRCNFALDVGEGDHEQWERVSRESERALGDDRVPTFGYGWVRGLGAASSEQDSEGQRCRCSPAKSSGMGGGRYHLRPTRRERRPPSPIKLPGA